jgi:ABC-type nitrate/sulfonate/bicarbonate transport system substrate-binding protein
VTTRGGTRWLKIPGAAVVCLALLLLLAPGGAGAPLTPVTITALPLEPAGLVFYAKEEGFFARHGLDAKILILSNPAQVAAALLSGGAQFAGAALSTAAILKSRNAPVRVVAAGALYRPSAPTTAVVAAPGKRIASARDLVGKTVAIDAPNTIAHIGLLKWLKRNGVSASEVNLREIPFPEMLGPLRRGTVDAAVLPEPFLTLAVHQGAKRIGDPFHAVCARTCLLTVFVARSDVDPLLAARVRNAIQAAAVWANKKKNDPASAAILARYVGIDRTLIAKEARTRFGERLRPALAQPWIDALAEFGVIPASFAAIDLVK